MLMQLFWRLAETMAIILFERLSANQLIAIIAAIKYGECLLRDMSVKVHLITNEWS